MKLARKAADEDAARTFEEPAGQEVMHAFGRLDLLYPKALACFAKMLTSAGNASWVLIFVPTYCFTLG